MEFCCGPTSLCVGALLCGRDDFVLRVVTFAAFTRAGAILGFGFSFGFSELGLVEQVVHLSIQKSQLGLDVFGQQDGPLRQRVFLLRCDSFILPLL